MKKLLAIMSAMLMVVSLLAGCGGAPASGSGAGTSSGGYELARSAKDISLKDVIDVVEGPWRLTRCADDSAACNRSAQDTCAFRREMCRISQRINEELAAVNFAALAEKA